MSRPAFIRTERLVGAEAMDRISKARVLLFGVGGVGSWCAEGLVRSGVERLTIVDSDLVSESNINRQLMATVHTIGRPKVEALKEHLLRINPEADIIALQQTYSDENYADFRMDEYDCIIDAIDSLKDKASLILRATATKAKFYSSMGAALKTDPRQVRVAEFWEVRGCPLGAALRKKLRREKTIPSKPFFCVYDEEVLPNAGESTEAPEHGKAVVNGTMAHITAIFGFTLSGLVLEDILRNDK
ncbi:MAG: tRNA threonylcarbamoyladenosine dehydratase [Bacteroidales bacterium]|nr:tRNA threonylcarbamoyladenosine dehydratase [Bacteroidales bacterium]MBQ4299565.1 tRNA threonylcarbamoyladenosine dehydratase [Bacteroidales bacterium]